MYDYVTSFNKFKGWRREEWRKVNWRKLLIYFKRVSNMCPHAKIIKNHTHKWRCWNLKLNNDLTILNKFFICWINTRVFFVINSISEVFILIKTPSQVFLLWVKYCFSTIPLTTITNSLGERRINKIVWFTWDLLSNSQEQNLTKQYYSYPKHYSLIKSKPLKITRGTILPHSIDQSLNLTRNFINSTTSFTVRFLLAYLAGTHYTIIQQQQQLIHTFLLSFFQLSLQAILFTL